MSLVNSGLLAWLAPLGAALVLLYMLRMKRRDVVVPALFLWPDRTEDVRANTFIQRPRLSLLFWLQLLVFTLLVLALAKPQIRQEGLSGGLTVFVLDVSASMSATDVRPSRFAAARQVVESALDTLRPGERLALIEAGVEPRVVFPLQNDTGTQRRLLREVEPTDTEADLSQALRLAGALVGTEPGARIVLLSDGVSEPVRDFNPGKAKFVFHSIGTGDRNLRIATLGVRDRLAYVEAENTSGTQLSGQLVVEIDGQLLDSRRFVLGPGKTLGKTLTLPREGQIITARIVATDQLSADNFASAAIGPAGRLRVLLVGRGNLFLERALTLDPRVTLDRASAVPPDQAEGYDIVIFDGVTETALRAPRVVNFGGLGSQWITVTGEAKTSEAKLDVSPGPPLEGVDLSGVYFGRTLRVKPKGGAETVAESTAGPLVIRTPNGFVTSFQPLESDFPLQVGFPIFIANLIDALAPESGLAPIEVKPGQPMSLAINSPVTLVHPDQTRQRLTPNDGTLVLRNLDKVGIYGLELADGRRSILVTMASPTESKIAPQVLLETTAGRIEAVRAPTQLADFVVPVLIAALVALITEWVFFMRKS